MQAEAGGGAGFLGRTKAFGREGESARSQVVSQLLAEGP